MLHAYLDVLETRKKSIFRSTVFRISGRSAGSLVAIPTSVFLSHYKKKTIVSKQTWRRFGTSRERIWFGPKKGEVSCQKTSGNVRTTWKAIYITYLFMCVCVRIARRVCVCMRVRACSLPSPVWNSYAPYCDIICGPLVSTTFCDIIYSTARFSKKMLLNVKCVFWFSLQLLSNTFFILRGN